MRFALNNRTVTTDVAAGTPALDFLRQNELLTGVKHACREGDCGSCVVLLGRRLGDRPAYQVVTSCLLPLGALADSHVVTVEGLNRDELTPIQAAFVDQGASQCGFCTPGFVVSFTGHLLEAETWDTGSAIEAVAGNICRCTGYTSIIRAMDHILTGLEERVPLTDPRVEALVREKILPDYFLDLDDLLPEPGVGQPSAPASTEIVVGGGTDLYVQRPHDLEDGRVYIVPPPPRQPIWQHEGHVYMAGTATAEDLKRSRIMADTVGGMDRAMELMGSLPIRNRASIAGNLVNASPIGDMTIALLALDAEVGLTSNGARRIAPLHRFFLGYKKLDLGPTELVEWVRFPMVENRMFNFEKVSKRTHLDIASVNTAISLTIEDGLITRAHLSAGGVAPIPLRLEKTISSLEGSEPTLSTAVAASASARDEVTPIDDVRGSAEYKRLLLGQLVLAHFVVLFDLEPEFATEAGS